MGGGNLGTFIWNELKQKLAHPKTWFMIIILFILSFQMIGDYRTETIRIPIEDSIERTGDTVAKNAGWVLMLYEEGPEISKESAQKWVDTGTQMKLAARRGDYVEWSRLNSFHYLIWGKAAAQNGLNREEQLSIFEEQALKIWDDVSGGISYEEIDFVNGDPMSRSRWFNHFLATSHYYHTLFEDELMPIGRYHMDSFTFIYHYLNEIVPLLLGLLILIMVFDSINHQWSNGGLKLILTQPFSRKKYLLAKGIIGVLHTLFILLIPVIVISLGLGITGGFDNYNYPVLFLEGGFTSFNPLANTLERDIETFGVRHQSLGISMYTHSQSEGIDPRLTLIPLYQFLILTVFLLILSVIFYVALNILISSTTKNKIVGFSIAGLITLAGIAISQRWVHGDKYNLSPFTMNNPVRILNGTYNVTALTAVIVLCLAILLVIIANVGYFQRKDL